MQVITGATILQTSSSSSSPS